MSTDRGKSLVRGQRCREVILHLPSSGEVTSVERANGSRHHLSGLVLASQPIKNVSDCSAREDRFWQAAPSPCRLNSACGNECCRSPGSRRAGQHDNQTTIVSHPDSLAKFEAPKSSSRMVLQLSNTDRSPVLLPQCCCRALFFLQARNGRVACHASALIQRWP